MAIQGGIKPGEGKMAKIGDIYLIGKVQVETFLDPTSRELVMNSISREIHDTKISEDMKSQAKARTQANFQSEEVDSTEERFFLPQRSNPLTFKKNSEALHILVGLRDEAHRFAITFHRKKREEYTLTSVLDEISGLGDKRKVLLLKNFESIDQLKEADIEDILKIPTFHRVLAERILVHLNSEDD